MNPTPHVFWTWHEDVKVMDDDYQSDAELTMVNMKPISPEKPTMFAVPVWMQGFWKCDYKTPITPVMCISGGWMSEEVAR